MQEIFLKLVLVCIVGKHAVTQEQCEWAAQQAFEVHREDLGVVWMPVVKRTRNPFSRLTRLYTGIPLLVAWRGWFKRRRWYNSRDYYLAATPPWKSRQNGQRLWYLGGYADDTCARPNERHAIAGLTWANPFGAARGPYTPIPIAHELGHLIGAEHDSAGCSLMHPAAMACFTGQTLRFSEQSKAQIEQCLD